MEIKFDPNLQFQLDAINAVVDVFQGQEKCETLFTVNSPESLLKHPDLYGRQSPFFDGIGYGNRLTLGQEVLLDNVQKTQRANGLKISDKIDRDNLDFTVEMETGTGKTYVYLRTILELYWRYGFCKHIIVVPSIPIKEGVYKSLGITEAHFRELYDKVRYNYFVYDSRNLNQVRSFSTSAELEIMVINIDAFSKSFKDPSKRNRANIIHRYHDALGYKPLDLIRNTKPIVFIDEPQTAMSTSLRKSAVENLNPLAIIRYSATHREKVNLMYRLNAVDAYEKKLVKQIEVGSIQTEGVNNQAYIKLLEIKLRRGKPVAKVEVDVLVGGSIQRKKITVRQNVDLEEKTGRTEYKGYIIRHIHGEEGNEYIDFTSRDDIVGLGQAIGSVIDRQARKVMISQTIEEHLEKERKLNAKGIKILSLFFIDEVAKYRQFDEEGNPSGGEYAQIFEDEYAKLIRKPENRELLQSLHGHELVMSEVHGGYFSVDKRRKKSNPKEDFEYYKDSKRRTTKADESTYSLIMRDKERLLSFDSKLRFIFSHSALREGWDNPNVFQICVLRDLGASSITPRQQIGRGLRLCVNQEGDRVPGHEVNTLFVMATESYGEFVRKLQEEIGKDTGIKFGIIEPDTFADVVVGATEAGHKPTLLGQEASNQIYQHLIHHRYLDQRGNVLDKLRIHLKESNVNLPEEISDEPHVEEGVLSRLKTAVGALEIRNRADRQIVEVNRDVLNDPKFRELWDSVKYKTTFSVNFDSNTLREKCITALNDKLTIQRGKLRYTKSRISMNLGGIEAGDPCNRLYDADYEVESLPDIVTYLQDETHLTRKTIVEILTECKKLEYFKVNPQAFIRSCTDIINDQMRLHIIDGIKYQKVSDNEFFSQELFMNEELYGYLNNLTPSKKSPYCHVVFDSSIESNLSNEFEECENVSVYSKLPSWFKIDTPLGAYNPDWAVSWNKDDQVTLFFVVESKSSISELDLRPKESLKIMCGKKHFEALNSRLIVARNIKDVTSDM